MHIWANFSITESYNKRYLKAKISSQEAVSIRSWWQSGHLDARTASKLLSILRSSRFRQETQ